MPDSTIKNGDTNNQTASVHIKIFV